MEVQFQKYIFYILALAIGTGHPIHSHHSKLHQSLTRKTKISKRLPQVKVQSKEKKSSFLTGQAIANPASTEDAKKKGTIRISGKYTSSNMRCLQVAVKQSCKG